MYETKGLVALTNGSMDRIGLGSGLGLLYSVPNTVTLKPFSPIYGKPTLVKKRFLGSEALHETF